MNDVVSLAFVITPVGRYSTVHTNTLAQRKEDRGPPAGNLASNIYASFIPFLYLDWHNQTKLPSLSPLNKTNQNQGHCILHLLDKVKV